MKYCERRSYLARNAVALFTRAWIEIPLYGCDTAIDKVALFTRAWIEIEYLEIEEEEVVVALFTRAWIEIYLNYDVSEDAPTSPSSRGRGLKYIVFNCFLRHSRVALFTRAWIEISSPSITAVLSPVALFTRAWIEICIRRTIRSKPTCRPLHEGVD